MNANAPILPYPLLIPQGPWRRFASDVHVAIKGQLRTNRLNFDLERTWSNAQAWCARQAQAADGQRRGSRALPI